MEPTAWIAAYRGHNPIHLSKADGWEVHAVVHEPASDKMTKAINRPLEPWAVKTWLRDNVCRDPFHQAILDYIDELNTYIDKMAK